MTRFVVGPASSIPPGTVKVVDPGSDHPSVGVYNVDGEFYALRNVCPHMGAPVCRGPIKGTSEPRRLQSGAFALSWCRQGEIVACPWHHWEFEIRTGRTVFPSRTRVRRFDVLVESGSSIDERMRKVLETIPVQVEDDSTVVLLLND